MAGQPLGIPATATGEMKLPEAEFYILVHDASALEGEDADRIRNQFRLEVQVLRGSPEHLQAGDEFKISGSVDEMERFLRRYY